MDALRSGGSSGPVDIDSVLVTGFANESSFPAPLVSLSDGWPCKHWCCLNGVVWRR